MDVLDKIKAPVAAELEQFGEAFRKTLFSDNPLLEKAVEHLLKGPGKQIRPLLVLLSARMVGKVSDKVIQVALAMEMLHTASLVHDDVVDESDRRRGLPSLNAFLSNQVAVLAGDFILSKALECAARTQDVRVVHYMSQVGQALAANCCSLTARIPTCCPRPLTSMSSAARRPACSLSVPAWVLWQQAAAMQKRSAWHSSAS